MSKQETIAGIMIGFIVGMFAGGILCSPSTGPTMAWMVIFGLVVVSAVALIIGISIGEKGRKP